jgi:hypothetical protein
MFDKYVYVYSYIGPVDDEEKSMEKIRNDMLREALGLPEG